MDNNPPKIPRQLQPKKMRTDAERLEIISRQKDSGLSVSDFCKQEGLHATQFYAWKKKLVLKIRGDFQFGVYLQS